MRESYRRPFNLMKKTFNDSIKRQSTERVDAIYSKRDKHYDIMYGEYINKRAMEMQNFTEFMRDFKHIGNFFGIYNMGGR